MSVKWIPPAEENKMAPNASTKRVERETTEPSRKDRQGRKENTSEIQPLQSWRLCVKLPSEPQPQRELNVTLAAWLAAGHLTEVGILAIIARSAILRRVGDVEGLHPELHPVPLGEGEVLED